MTNTRRRLRQGHHHRTYSHKRQNRNQVRRHPGFHSRTACFAVSLPRRRSFRSVRRISRVRRWNLRLRCYEQVSAHRLWSEHERRVARAFVYVTAAAGLERCHQGYGCREPWADQFYREVDALARAETGSVTFYDAAWLACRDRLLAEWRGWVEAGNIVFANDSDLTVFLLRWS